MERPAGRKKSSPSLKTSKPADGGNDTQPEVALDAEIDRFLDEKAAKSNLSGTNVRNVINLVVKDTRVQKMITAIVKRNEKAERMKGNKDGLVNGTKASGDESDEDLDCFGPKLTRAKTKELMENHDQAQPALWPSVTLGSHSYSTPSETQILITQLDLPEESEAEDEEYIPKESELHNVGIIILFLLCKSS